MEIENIENIEKYTISAHGSLLFSMSNDTKNYYPFTIPDNVDIITFTELGDKLLCSNSIQHEICKKESKKQNVFIEYPAPRYKYNTTFPNILFVSDDIGERKTFYSGIVHCNTNKVIYNIDALKSQNCSCESISKISSTISKKKDDDYKYKCTKNYYENDALFTSCGPILLEDAVNKIIEHWNMLNKPNTRIEIYITACLEERDIQFFYHSPMIKKSKFNQDIINIIKLLNSRTPSSFQPYRRPLFKDDYETDQIIFVINTINFTIIVKKNVVKEAHEISKIRNLLIHSFKLIILETTKILVPIEITNLLQQIPNYFNKHNTINLTEVLDFNDRQEIVDTIVKQLKLLMKTSDKITGSGVRRKQKRTRRRKQKITRRRKQKKTKKTKRKQKISRIRKQKQEKIYK